jgi:arylsulfatase
MIDHDKNVGQMLDLLDELGIADDTFVMYSSDNGPHMNTWPDGAMTPFRSEKNTNWEGAFRVPMLVRWPGRIAAGRISTGIVQHHDWLRTLLAMAGDTDCADRLKKGTTVNGKPFKNHIDGYNMLPYLTGEQKESPAPVLLLLQRRRRRAGRALRQLEARVHGTALSRHAASVGGAVHAASGPKLFNLRTDPYERADVTSNTYYDFLLHNMYFLYAAQAAAQKFAETFKEFPPAQKPGSFTIDDAMKKMSEATSGAS